jgi:hypothetical protein
MRNSKGGYDLIDGQQRFTTIGLIGYILKGQVGRFLYSSNGSERASRLSFAIRDYCNDYLKNPASLESFTDAQKQEIAPLVDAVEVVKGLFSDSNFFDGSKKDLSDFIFYKVNVVATQVPFTIDENKLFEATNNRGEQLQQHEILKSKLLKRLPANDRPKYAQIWEACSIMDEYIERNIKEVANLTWAQLAFKNNTTEKEVEPPEDIFSILKNVREEAKDLSLLEIIDDYDEDEISDPVESSEKIEYDSGKVRSIISFPMLLLHTLRIFLFTKRAKREDKEIPPVDGTRLLRLFETHFRRHETSPDDIAEFILLLWKIRIKFDKHVIKWVTVDNAEIHTIRKLYLNDNTLQRRDQEDNSGFALLQSMLYHSQEIITHYWLTPFLYRMVEKDLVRGPSSYLKRLDNLMFCSGSEEELRIRSWNLLGKDLKGLTGLGGDVGYLKLDEPIGTKFPSYIFYKLDYVLWSLRKEIFLSKGRSLAQNSMEAWGDFRMTSRSSVEHVSPQIPKEYDGNVVWDSDDPDAVRDQKRDDFGNLVLISVSMNSEYSNKSFKTKRNEFWEKGRLDSLKSALIFSNTKWDWERCVQHREEMKTYLRQYFEKTK